MTTTEVAPDYEQSAPAQGPWPSKSLVWTASVIALLIALLCAVGLSAIGGGIAAKNGTPAGSLVAGNVSLIPAPGWEVVEVADQAPNSATMTKGGAVATLTSVQVAEPTSLQQQLTQLRDAAGGDVGTTGDTFDFQIASKQPGLGMSFENEETVGLFVVAYDPTTQTSSQLVLTAPASEQSTISSDAPRIASTIRIDGPAS